MNSSFITSKPVYYTVSTLENSAYPDHLTSDAYQVFRRIKVKYTIYILINTQAPIKEHRPDLSTNVWRTESDVMTVSAVKKIFSFKSILLLDSSLSRIIPHPPPHTHFGA